MTALWQQLFADMALMTQLELLAVLSALAYVLLALKQSLWCWPAALLSTLLYSHIMWHSALLSDALLQIYYAGMALYGWYNWRRLQQQQSHQHGMTEFSLVFHGRLIAATAGAGLLLGYLMNRYTQADFAWVDAQTTTFSVLATFLVARKVVSNWLYWVVIDAVCIYVYIEKHLYFTTALFVLYTLIALAGFFLWRQSYRQQQQPA
ncbi:MULTISPECIES: nicotinamide riboside transporter PnuC [Rheinheimera]|uniref:Nicotinamide riboside transporter PnuC n=1 Tax=Rheinheimera marina TaxID=1774958 RepID=A0ABV9JM10_9GAMM